MSSESEDRAEVAERENSVTEAREEEERAFISKHPPTLTGKQRRALRAQAHHLRPLLQLGKGGMSEGFFSALRTAIEAHELVKVSLLSEAPVDRKEAAEQLAEQSGAHLIQLLGRSVVLFRRNPRAPKVSLPSKRASAKESGSARAAAARREEARAKKRAERSKAGSGATPSKRREPQGGRGR
ncbi:MAG: ribosome assembly RNA-binding protein YhbY [Myxococcota bacterium]|nr:ribosome assembly RNA-binding protein YhbY [Myxococcota bacterium]